MSDAALIVKSKYFRGLLTSWDAIFAEAAAFATTIGREHLIGISHSQAVTEGVVTVWYWDIPE